MTNNTTVAVMDGIPFEATKRELYQQLIRIMPAVLYGESDLAAIVQTDGNVSLTFKNETDGVISIVQYATFFGEEDVTVKYMLYIDHKQRLATPLAIVLSAPPETVVFEATEEFARYLSTLLQIATDCPYI